MPHTNPGSAHPAVHAAQAKLPETIALLSAFLRHPAISCDSAHAGDVAGLATAIAAHLNTMGPDTCEVLTLKDAHPLVAAAWLGAGPKAPTILIYGHYDLQPVKGEPWTTPPHEPTVIGDRLYARGAADDMGGWVSHMAAIQAWRETRGGLPCNLRLVIEGEEEIGSPHLEAYMDAYPQVFAADAMVLTDCENPSTDVPGLTISLRGLSEMVLEVAALTADGHSGLWGNAVPDVSTALMTIVAALVDGNGRPRHGLIDWPAAQREAAAAVPIPDDVVRKGAHLRDDVAPLPVAERSRAEWLWLQPALTVVTTTLPTPDRKKNALRSAAEATLSVRTAPGQTAEQLHAILARAVAAAAPQGVQARLTLKPGAGEGWLYTPRGPAFAAVDRAYQAAWGRKMVQVGIGGSIPFVALFGRRFATLPLILNGVMDPETTAHGPNESLHLGVFAKAVAASVLLYEELAAPGVLRP
ncbi:MAG: M20/M25/M40 family metallo-hydrolase [Deltaproteobacteria bacterium]|nr:M20/M25/M40 family metallo-hydrolase [Deltaproteobacteria bacterium]